MEIFTIFLRTILIYFVIVIIMRMMGKREIGKLSVFDLVVSIMIAEMAVIVIEDAKRPMLEGLVPMLTLVIIQIGIALISLKSQKIRYLIEGKPAILIDKGEIQVSEMKKMRYNLDDLLIQLREKNIANVADVEFAILEPSGKLSIFPKEEKAPPTREEIGVTAPNIGLPLPLIMDGKVQDDTLKKIQKTRFWLKNELQALGCHDFKEVFFASIDYRGKIFISKKKN